MVDSIFPHFLLHVLICPSLWALIGTKINFLNGIITNASTKKNIFKAYAWNILCLEIKCRNFIEK